MPINLSPNMSLPVPIVGQEGGPQWATDLNNSLNIIDGHNHSPGSGTQVGPSGLNINTDLTFLSNNATALRSVRFTPQVSPIAGVSDIGCIYEAGVDLWYTDGNGNQIQLTQNGSISGTAGSISGLVAPASASYNAGTSTFIWQSDALTSADMDFGSAIFRNDTPSSFGVTVSAPAALGSNYSLVLPTVPGSTKFLSLDASGNMAAQWAVDNSSIEISSNLVQLKNAGITEPKYATGSVSTRALADGSVTAAKLNGAFSFNYDATIYTANNTYVVPAGVTTIIASAAGGGGGGGGGDNGGTHGGGAGGGGAPLVTIPLVVVPGETLTLAIGAGGTGGLGSNVTGSGASQPGATGGSTIIAGSTSGNLAVFVGAPGGLQGAAASGQSARLGTNGFIFTIGGEVNKSLAGAATNPNGEVSITSFTSQSGPGVGGLSGSGGANGYGVGGNGGNSGGTAGSVGVIGGISSGGGGGGGNTGPAGNAGGAGGDGIIILFVPSFT